MKQLKCTLLCAAALVVTATTASVALADGGAASSAPSHTTAWVDPAYGAWHSCTMGGGGRLLNAVISSNNPRRMYAYGDMDGLFRSDDAGNSWRMIHGGIEEKQGEYGFAGVLTDPKNADTVEVATGEQDGPRQGVFLSGDGGQTWTKTLDARFYANGPYNPGVRLAGSSSKTGFAICASDGSGVWRSSNGGRTWLDCGLRGVYFTDVAIDRTNPQRIWMCAEPEQFGSGEFKSLTGGFYRSDDKGHTWTKLSEESPFTVQQDPVDGGALYGLFDTTVKKSTDGGVTWQDFSTGLPPAGKASDGSAPFSTAGAGPDFVLLLAEDTKTIYRLDSGQTSWKKIVPIYSTVGWRLGFVNPPAGGSSSIVVSPTNKNHWYVTDCWGMYQSWDAGQNWTASNTGIETTVIHTLLQNPADTSSVYLGAGDVGFWWSDNAGQVLTQTISSGAGWVGNIKCIDASPKLPNRIYAAGGEGWRSNRVFVSNDGGKSVNLAAMAGMGLPDGSYACDSIAVDPNDPESVYVTTSENIGSSSGGVYHSTDGAKTWTWMGQGLPAGQMVFLDNIWWGGRELAMGPDGCLLAVSANANSLFKFDKNAGSWSKIPFDHIGGMYSVVADYKTPGRFYVCVVGDDTKNDNASGGLYRTDDDGASWTKILSGSVHCIALDRGVQDRIAASTPSGVVLSTDAGKTWSPLEWNPNHSFYGALAFAGSHLLAGTGGNGAFWIDVSAIKHQKAGA